MRSWQTLIVGWTSSGNSIDSHAAIDVSWRTVERVAQDRNWFDHRSPQSYEQLDVGDAPGSCMAT